MARLYLFRVPLPIFRVSVPAAFLCVLQVAAVGLAQQPDPNGTPSEAEEQTTGCPRLTVLPEMPWAKAISCQKADSVEVSFPLPPDSNGYAREKRIRGPYEFREYHVKKVEQESTFDRLLAALPMAGFTIKCAMKPATISGRNGDLWILINVADETYTVSVVREPPQEWPAVRTAEEISREMQLHGQVDIYGITFLPTDQSIVEKDSQILFEVLKYLKQNNAVSVIVESDKVTPHRPSDDDAEITRERANAVMDWLIAHGVPRSHIQPRPAGRNNQLTANESPSEIQRNERIVLIRAKS